MTDENRRYLLAILNEALTAGTTPQDWQKALVVEIHKGKGSLTDPNNYRPVSLLSTAYKLMAHIIKPLKQRLEKAIDDRPRSSQYGFRAGRLTSQPVHILCRLLERPERTNTSLCVLLLDWKEAFDRVSVDALEVAMQRYGVPQSMVTLISSIYTSQLFQVRAAGHTSDVLCAHWCPARMPPRTVPLPHGAQHDPARRGPTVENGGMMPWVFGQQTSFYDLAYADDTALVASTAERAEQLLLTATWP